VIGTFPSNIRRDILRILLVNVQKSVPDYVTRYDPLGLAYLASYAKRVFPELDISISTSSDVSSISKNRFDMIGFSSVSQNFSLAIEMIHRLSCIDIPLLVGGVHITLLPKCLPKGEHVIGVLGEGEQTFVDLINLYLNRGRFSSEGLSQINGIAYRDDADQLVFTPTRPPIFPLDSLPFPDRNILNIPNGGTTYIFSSRGCPYKCIFCASTRLHDRLRLFSAEYVVNEICQITSQYRPIHIKFYDDLFIASKKRLFDIVQILTRTRIAREVLFSINAAASMINDETAKLLRQMNVYSVGMGLESGNQNILTYLKSGQATVEKNLHAVDVLVKHGINPSASFIVGAPHEDESSFADTLKFLFKSKISKSYLYLLTPYPGTPLWDYAKEKGLVSDEMDWNRLDINENTNFDNRIILSENLSPEILRKLFKQFSSVSRKKYFQRLIVQGFKRPDLIIPFFKLHLVKR
jgi:anaerobic magnesium-protoporphyrin IX monomethyl ester cyclase